MSLIEGKFEHESSENFVEYLEAIGMVEEMRNLTSNFKPIAEISKNSGGIYKIKTYIPGHAHEIEFSLDKEFDEKTIDGRKSKSKIVLLDENKLYQTQKFGKDDTGIVIREFFENSMKMTNTGGGVTAIRVFKRIE